MTVLIREHVVRRSGLALRVRDLATGRPVTDGLTAVAWPDDDPTDVRVATAPTAAGVLGFVRLRGLGAYEDGSTTRAAWFTSPVERAPRIVTVRVVDRTGAHLPVVRSLLVPAARPVEVSLPRAATTAPPPGHLTVTSQVVAEGGGPAAWALVELRVGGFVTGGVTDERGTVVVPVPRAVPPTADGTSASGPVWRMTVRVRFRPASQVRAPGTTPEDPPTFPSITGQPEALVQNGGVFVPTLERDATTGGPLVLASNPEPAPQILLVRAQP